MPRYCSAIAAHSTCQPGRPRPNGESQAGSPGRSACQSRQSSGSRLPARSGSPPRSANSARIVSASRPDTLPKSGSDFTAKYRSPSTSYTAPSRCSAAIDLDHLRDRLDRPDVVRRRQHPQRGHVVAEQLRLLLRELDPVDTGLAGALEQRVVDVGDVLRVPDLMAGIAPEPLDQIEGQVRRRMAHVGCVVRRDATHVHPRRPGTGNRLDERLRRAVEQAESPRLPGKFRDVWRSPRLHGPEPIRWSHPSRQPPRSLDGAGQGSMRTAVPVTRIPVSSPAGTSTSSSLGRP